MAILVQQMCFRPFDYSSFLYPALVPPEAQTPEFLRDCDLVDGAMLGECGDEVDAAFLRMEKSMDKWMLIKGPVGKIDLPCPVVRIVTMTHMG